MILKKSRQTVVLIFSKEFLIGALIFVTPLPNLTQSSLKNSTEISEVPQSSIVKSNDLAVRKSLQSLRSPSPIIDSILKLKGGGFDFDGESEETKKLIDSLMAKTPQSSEDKISLNKFLQKMIKIADPLISSPKFWKMVQVSRKPVDPDFPESWLKAWFKFSV